MIAQTFLAQQLLKGNIITFFFLNLFKRYYSVRIWLSGQYKRKKQRERERTKLIQSGEMAAGLSSRALFLSINNNNNNNNYHQHHCSQTFRFSFEERRGRRRVSRSRSFSSLPLSLSTSNRVSSPSSRPVLCQSSSTDLDVAAQAGQDRLLKVRSNFYFFFWVLFQ